MKKRWLALTVCLVMTASLFSGCGKKKDDGGNATTQPTSSAATQGGSEGTSAADGNAPELAADATYRTLYTGEISTLNYLTTGTTNDFTVSANVVDTLVEYDRFGKIQPSLATDWSTSEDGTVWTFHIRQGQKWYDNNGNEMADVTAHDFVSSMKYVLTSEYESTTAQNLFGVIKNAREYYNGTMAADDPETEEVEGVPIDFSEVGVKATDDYTLEYTLEAPVPYFLSSLTYICYMPAYGPLLEEKGADFGAATDASTIYYCGAYILQEFWPQEKRIYVKNENNWDADNVFITKMEQTYNAEASNLTPTMVLRDEVDYASLSADIVDEWLNDPEKEKMVSMSRATVDYSYFFCFNFDPKFDAEYEPDNWKIAVNNENFRQAVMAALDRVRILSISAPNNAESLVENCITPKTFALLDDKDFTEFGDLSAISARNSFDEAKAVEFRDKAKEELTQAGATFPIKVLMSYNPTVANWESECIVLEQQVEGLLGSDFIDIVVLAGPSQNFLSEVRRAGKYALMKCNWGADYADPETWTDPFRKESNSYNFMSVSVDEGGASAAVINEYFDLVAAAKAEVIDLNARYEAFAKAEAYLINHALVIPHSIGTTDYQVSKLNVFEGQYAPFGVSTLRYKGQHLLAAPISMDQFNANYEQWLKDADAAK